MLNKAKPIGSALCHGKNDYGDDKFIFYGLFLAAKIKFVSTIDKYGIIHAHKTFKGYTESKRSLDHVQYFKRVEGKKVSVMLPKNWESSFSSGIILLKESL